MATAKYIRTYVNDNGFRYFLILEKEYIPVRFRRKIEELSLVFKCGEWLYNYVTDYKCLRLVNGLYSTDNRYPFYTTGWYEKQVTV